MFSCKIIMSARERAFFLREGIWRNILGIRKGENIMANKIDLHMHSTFSDGTLSPDELIAQLKGQGISVFSLTDHDTMRGVSEIRKRDLQGMIFINGIEFSCRTEAGKCHILGYGYDPQSSAMRGIVETGMAKRAAKMEKRIDYLRERGITLTDEERKTLQPLHSKGKPHLAAILVKRGLARNNDEAIREYIDPVHTGNSRIDAKDAVGAILWAGGIPVWAHPLGGQGEDAPSEEAFRRQLALLMSYGIRGLECYYSKYSPKEAEKLAAAAAANGLFVSGGSDFHGAAKPGLPAGRLNSLDEDVTAEKLTILKALGTRRE